MKFSFVIIFFLLLTKIANANEYNFKKIVPLDKPWGSTFINDDQILLTEVSGKIKLVNIKSKKTKLGLSPYKSVYNEVRRSFIEC